MLASNSEYGYYDQLQKEVDGAFNDPSGPLDWEILAHLPFLNAVINEALRLASPYYLPRIVPKGGVTIDGDYIPGGVTVAIAAYSQQMSEENFYPHPLVCIFILADTVSNSPNCRIFELKGGYPLVWVPIRKSTSRHYFLFPQVDVSSD